MDSTDSEHEARSTTAGRPSHFEPRTGAEQPWEVEDVVRAAGQDPTPENVEYWRRKLEKEGPSAIEKLVP